MRIDEIDLGAKALLSIVTGCPSGNGFGKLLYFVLKRLEFNEQKFDQELLMKLFMSLYLKGGDSI